MTEESALQRLETLCVAAERCRHELSEKLRRWGFMGDDADKILDSLEKRRFFDDSRFASAYTRDKLLYNRWGRLKIIMGLREKRIDRSTIDEALDEIDDEEYERVATEYLTAKAHTIKEGFTYDGRTKLYRQGIHRGFEASLVARIVKSPDTWPHKEDDEDEEYDED